MSKPSIKGVNDCAGILQDKWKTKDPFLIRKNHVTVTDVLINYSKVIKSRTY